MKLRILLPLFILGVATSLYGCTESQKIVKVIPNEALNLIQENQGNPDFIIVDTQPLEEYERRHIDSAINIPIDREAFRKALNKLDKNKIYLIYGQ